MLWRYYWWHDHYTGFGKPFLKLLLAAIYLAPLYLTFSDLKGGSSGEWILRIFGVVFFVFLWSSKGYYGCRLRGEEEIEFGPRACFKDFLIRWIITLFCAVVASLPAWTYLLLRTTFTAPVWWQNLNPLPGGLLIFGALQLILGVIFIKLMVDFVWN